ncbi:MAG: response regulator [Nitrososphaerota archaeon]
MARVMVAEDSNAIRLVLQDILQLGNHELVAEAVDGIDAIEKYNSVKPDILLLDLAMPKKDGITVAKEILQLDPHAKIIIVTATDNQKIINECLEVGAKHCIIKPFEFSDVLNAINSICG